MVGDGSLDYAGKPCTMSSDVRTSLVPFASYATVLRGGNLMNVILFYPAGLLLVGFLGDRWKRYGKILLILVICCLLSLGIEHLQYHLGIGLAETDDVLHNSLGGVIGAISSWMPAACKYGK